MKSIVKFAMFLGIMLFPALLVQAGELKLIREYKYDADLGFFRKMDPNRFILVGYVLDKTGQGRGIQYKMFDMKTREFTVISFPVEKFQEKFPEILGTKSAPQLAAYNGETSCLTMNLLDGYKTVAWYYCQYDHKTGRISKMLKMGDVKDKQVVGNLGIDPSGKYFYFATYYYQGEKAELATIAMHVSRVNLEKCEIDWDLMVTFLKRPRQLDVHYWVFNNDGTKLALLEYNDKAWEKESHATPGPMAYVIDIPSKNIDTYPIPLSPYGRVFTPDGKYIFIGSNEEGKIIRVNLEKKKVDLEGPAIHRIFDLVLTPRARSLMVFADTTLVSPKVVEVRSTKDLGLLASIPARLLMPGDKNDSPGGVLSFDDGKYIAYTVPSGDKEKGKKAFRIYEVPDDLDSPKVAGTTEKDLMASQGIVLAHQYADTHGIEIAGKDRDTEDPEKTFASIVVTKQRIYFTGTSGIDEGNYQPSRTRPVVICLDTSGKMIWQRELPKKGFVDYRGAALAVDGQGNCVDFIISYYNPGNYGVSRFVKLNSAGKVLWDTQLRGMGAYNTPLADDKQLLPNGSISIKGRIDLNENDKHYWAGEISRDGKVISDITLGQINN